MLQIPLEWVPMERSSHEFTSERLEDLKNLAMSQDSKYTLAEMMLTEVCPHLRKIFRFL